MSDQIKNEKNVSSFAVCIDEIFANNTIVHDKKRTDILFECEMKLLTQNPKSYSNIPERNIMGLAAVSNTF